MRNIKKFLSASISFVLILSMLIGVLNVSNVFASPATNNDWSTGWKRCTVDDGSVLIGHSYAACYSNNRTGINLQSGEEVYISDVSNGMGYCSDKSGWFSLSYLDAISHSDDTSQNCTAESSEDAKNILDYAIAHLSYTEGDNNENVFAPALGFANNRLWCASFISYVGLEAGIDNSILYRSASCYDIAKNFYECGNFRNEDSGYVPNPGDIVFFDWGCRHHEFGYRRETFDHVGIVEYVDDDGLIHTIEGNTHQQSRYGSDGVFRRTRSSCTIIGYGVIS